MDGRTITAFAWSFWRKQRVILNRTVSPPTGKIIGRNWIDSETLTLAGEKFVASSCVLASIYTLTILLCTVQNNLLYSVGVHPTTPSHWRVKISISLCLYKGAYNLIFLMHKEMTFHLLVAKWEIVNWLNILFRSSVGITGEIQENLATAGCLPAVRPTTYRIRLICSLWSQNKRGASGLC